MKQEYVAQITRGWPADGALERAETITASSTVQNGDLVQGQSDGTVALSGVANTRRAGLVIRGNGDSASAKNANKALVLWKGYIVASTNYNTAHTYVPGSPITVSRGQYTLANGAASATFANTSLTWASGVVTVVAAGNGFFTGQSVTIAGVTPAGYNGVYTITSIDANTFTYALVTNPGAVTVVGTSASLIDPEIGYVLQVRGVSANYSASLDIVVY